MLRLPFNINKALLVQCLLILLLLCALSGFACSVIKDDLPFAIAFICTALLAVIESIKVRKGD